MKDLKDRTLVALASRYSLTTTYLAGLVILEVAAIHAGLLPPSWIGHS